MFLQIDVKKSVPQEGKPRACKIFVGGLSPETSEDDFKTYFSQFGDVAEVQIMQDHMSGRSRGFGFVTFVEDDSAEKVFAAGQMHELGGKRVEVKPATPKGAGSQTSRPIPPPRGAAGEYASNMMPPLAGFGTGMSHAGYQTYNPNMYGYGHRPGGVPYGGGPYAGSVQYHGMPPTQYMMMQPPYPPPAPYPQYPQFPSPHHPGQGAPPGGSHNPFVRVSPQYPISSMPSPPYGPNVSSSRARSGRNERNKVDSASSFDQQQVGFERQLRKLNLE